LKNTTGGRLRQIQPVFSLIVIPPPERRNVETLRRREYLLES